MPELTAYREWVRQNRQRWESNKKYKTWDWEDYAQCESCLTYAHYADLSICARCKDLVCLLCGEEDTGFHGEENCESPGDPG